MSSQRSSSPAGPIGSNRKMLGEFMADLADGARLEINQNLSRREAILSHRLEAAHPESRTLSPVYCTEYVGVVVRPGAHRRIGGQGLPGAAWGIQKRKRRIPLRQ